jgi:hypothetical protein
LYVEVDKKKIGRAYKDDLIKAIEKDIIKMQKEQEEAEEESPEEQEESDKGNEAVRTSSGSFARVRTMS